MRSRQGSSGRSRARAQFSANIALIAPASFISLIVPLGVFFAFQRYFVQGRRAGSVK
jgi:alpha-glucoside transport system permease protein